MAQSPWWPHTRFESDVPGELLEAWHEALRLADEGRTRSATARLEALAAEHPGFVPALSKLAALLAEQGHTDEARSWLDRALAADPHYPPALNNRGNLLLEEGRIQEAIDHYQKALAVDPLYSTARHNLAVALRRQGDISGFVREFKRAQRLRLQEQNIEIRERARRAQQEGRGGCLSGAALLLLLPLIAVVALSRWP